MNVTRDVVNDLLTVYLAGDASTDTQDLVEEWLRQDPDLARQVARARNLELPAVPAPPPTTEKRALDRTRRLWRLRAVVLGAAIYFATLPLSVTFDSRGFQGWLLHDWTSRMLALLVAGSLVGIYVVLSRRLR
jgi:anti-sigma factor RsiW